MMIRGVFSSVFSVFGGLIFKLPEISDISTSEISDTSFKINANILSNKFDTTITIRYGLTSDVLLEQAVVTGSPVMGTENNPVAIQSIISGLLPDKKYYYQIVATNVKGVKISEIGSLFTIKPIELTDGNWKAMFDFEGDQNVIASNLVSQFRDNFQNNALGNELVPNGDFSTTTGWTLNGAGTITDGKLNLSTSGFTTIWRFDNTAYRYRIYTSSFDVDSITGTLKFYCPNPSPANITTPGTKTFQAYIQDGTYVARIGANNASLVAVIDNFSTKEILGNHLVQWTDTNKPTKSTNYIEFDGVNNWMRTSTLINSIGTVYAIVQRVGTDDDFVIRNDFTGIGEFAANYLRIGSNQAGTTWYNVRIKKILIRSVVDSAGTIEKLNEYLNRAEVPLGVTPFGVFSNDAVYDNNAIWNNGN